MAIKLGYSLLMTNLLKTNRAAKMDRLLHTPEAATDRAAQIARLILSNALPVHFGLVITFGSLRARMAGQLGQNRVAVVAVQ